jgi:subtilisin family serine protease
MSRFTPTGSFRGALALAALAALAACSDSPVASSNIVPPDVAAFAKADAEEPVVAGEIIVKLRDGSALDLDQLVARLSAHAAKKGRKGYAGKFDILQTLKGNERALAAIVAAMPGVEYAEPNWIRHTDAVDSRLWAFYNPGGLNMKFSDPADARYGTYIPASYASVADADEDNIAGYAANGADVVIGSIDTGVDFTHPEFTGRLIAGRDWLDNDADPSDTPDEGHGTHTTGTAAGTNVGVAGVAGAAPHVKVFVQRVCGAAGCPTSAIINAINAAADFRDAAGKPLVAVNFSIGGSVESSGEKTAIQRLTSNGTLFVASAGNAGTSRVACPACDVNAISVAATNWQDQRAAYSQYGSGLDISAPGGYCYSNTTPEGCIFSSVSTGYTGGAVSGPTSGAYGWMQGTSMAAPQVTGTAAVVASVTGLRGAQLRTRILSTADDKGVAGTDKQFGAGRLNTYRAVKGVSLAAGQ